MIPERIKEIAELEAAATKGPWTRWLRNFAIFCGNVTENSSGHMKMDRGAYRICELSTDDNDQVDEEEAVIQAGHDCDFIAESRDAVPDLLAHVATLTTRLAAETEARERMEQERDTHSKARGEIGPLKHRIAELNVERERAEARAAELQEGIDLCAEQLRRRNGCNWCDADFLETGGKHVGKCFVPEIEELSFPAPTDNKPGQSMLDEVLTFRRAMVGITENGETHATAMVRVNNELATVRERLGIVWAFNAGGEWFDRSHIQVRRAGPAGTYWFLVRNGDAGDGGAWLQRDGSWGGREPQPVPDARGGVYGVGEDPRRPEVPVICDCGACRDCLRAQGISDELELEPDTFDEPEEWEMDDDDQG